MRTIFLSLLLIGNIFSLNAQNCDWKKMENKIIKSTKQYFRKQGKKIYIFNIYDDIHGIGLQSLLDEEKRKFAYQKGQIIHFSFINSNKNSEPATIKVFDGNKNLVKNIKTSLGKTSYTKLNITKNSVYIIQADYKNNRGNVMLLNYLVIPDESKKKNGN